jgi:PAS domain S-box-containing protein
MGTPLDTDSSRSTELTDLRRQVCELQEALARAEQGRARFDEHESAQSTAGTVKNNLQRNQAALTEQEFRDTLDAQAREQTAGLEKIVFGLKKEVERRQQAESALKASEQRYQTLYEQNPYMYFTLTADCTVLSANYFGADQLGYQKADLIGQSILRLFDQKDHQAVLGHMTTCVANPYKLFQWEIEKIRNDGTRLWVRERARAIHDHTGQIFVLVVCEDITEHKRTETQLHETSRLLHTLVKESALPLVSLDRDARVTSWNQAATRLFGWSEDEVLGRELPYIPPGEETRADALWHTGIRGELAGPIELRRCRKDGTMLDLLLWPVFVYDTFGELSVAVGLYVDQSDLKQVENQLRESEQAIRSLHETTSKPGLTFDQRIQAVLELGCRRCDLPIGLLTVLEGEHLKFTHIFGGSASLLEGMSLPLQNTYCSVTLQMDTPLAFEHAGVSKWRSHPCYKTLGLECYIGAKLTSAGRACGTICFVGSKPYPRPFNQADKDFLLLIARWISGEFDRKSSETALREQEALLRSVIETATDAIFMKDREGRYQFINSAGALVIGRPTEEIIGKNDDEIFPQDTANWLMTDDRKVFSGSAQRRFEEISSLDGESRTFYSIKTPHYDQSGNVVGLVGVARDMTDVKRAEEALRASELRLQRFVAEAPVGLCILDQNWRAISANKALCELTGYDEHEIVGSTYALYTHPDDLAANIVLTDEFFRGVRSNYTYEKRYIRKSGEIIWVSVKATRVELSGYTGPLLLAAVQDITERKLAIDEREHLSRDLHDNILQALYAVGMQLEAGKLSIGKSARRSKIHLSRAVDQLNNLMLDVRRFIALLTQRTPSELDFGQALRQLIASMSGAGRSTPELDITNPVLSFITPKLGEQLLNIAREALSNSLRHAQASHRWVRLSLAENAIRLIIGDNGVGFSAKRKRRAGHGLGNMAARAKQISATFTLESGPGKGTTVLIVVPLKRKHMYE